MTAQTFHAARVALGWINSGRQVAIATVVETWGSAPRPAGAQLVIDAHGNFEGSVSGGCVEAAVVTEAMDAMADGNCRLLEYGISSETAFAVGLACGGTIKIIVEPVAIGNGPGVDALQHLEAARQNREPAVVLVNVVTWQRHMADRGAGASLTDDINSRILADKSGLNGDCYIGIHNPSLRLIVVGGVHIAQSLIPMAQMAGYDVTLIDPREAFASATRFPDVTLIHDWPDEAIATLAPDQRTAVVTLSHDPKIDDPAILETLKTTAFYIGSLGSRKTHGKRLERLTTVGVAADEQNRIHAPVGLNINAKSPAEIAVSIMAELTAHSRADPNG